MPLLEVQHVQKIYTTRFGGTQVQALSNVSFSVEEGEYVAIMGESGSGKTTLLNILAALDRPTAGEVLLEGRPLSAIRERDLAAFRRSHLGFVFQDFNLLDTFSLQDNIYLPLVLAGTDYREMQQKLRPIADQLGISGILVKYPYEVSGGQKQRAAVARALITDPPVDPGRRTHRRSGLPVLRRPAGAVRRTERHRADHFDGHPLGKGGQPRWTGVVPPGRTGVPPALPGRREPGGPVPPDLRHPDGPGGRR